MGCNLWVGTQNTQNFGAGHPVSVKNKGLQTKQIIFEQGEDRKIHEPEEDEKFPIDSSLEWLVWLEIKPVVFLTTCCSKIICTKCSTKIRTCPQRCNKPEKLYKMSKELNQNLQKLTIECKLCLIDIKAVDKVLHSQNWCADLLSDRINLRALHGTELTMLKNWNERGWNCACRTMTNDDHFDHLGAAPFQCQRCPVKFCRTCVLKGILRVCEKDIKWIDCRIGQNRNQPNFQRAQNRRFDRLIDFEDVDAPRNDLWDDFHFEDVAPIQREELARRDPFRIHLGRFVPAPPPPLPPAPPQLSKFSYILLFCKFN